MAGEPAFYALALYRCRKRFVERRVAADEDDLVRELVEQQRRELPFGTADEGVQQRVGEPAQRRVSRHTGDVDFVALGAQRLRCGFRVSLVEVTAIASAAHHRVAPLLQLERKLGRREHVPRDVRALKVGIARVTAVVRQTQFTRRIRTHLLRAFQPLLERGRGRRVSDDLGNRTRRIEHRKMPVDRLRVVVQRGAAGAERKRQRADDGDEPPGAATDDAGARRAA